MDHQPLPQIVLVDDGSSDDTLDTMRRFAAEYPERVRAIGQTNAGKGAALNRGIAAVSAEVVLLVDSDVSFGPTTIQELVVPFFDSRVGAVCGDDRPVNLDRVQTKFLAIIGHVGMGLMRRALDVLGCLPIVSGNVGAFRGSLLRRLGGLDEHALGEDLELTFRVQQSGYKVVFAPRTVVYAESASTLRGLWRQRVRWMRGLLQTLRRHRGVIGNLRHGIFGGYLVYLVIGSVLTPLLQLGGLVVIALLVLLPGVPYDPGLNSVLAWVLWLGVPLSLALVVLAAALNKSLRDLRYFWTLPLWPLCSVMMNLVAVAGIWARSREPSRLSGPGRPSRRATDGGGGHDGEDPELARSAATGRPRSPPRGARSWRPVRRSSRDGCRP